ncbi:hypothetical protein BRC85_10505 [Halobacteriales archaeon QS_1_69_70]|nr:MAG: hypothetical protein BRC85_10505 [Halobacteriales archaeon QS_1_69_70]
MGLETAKVEAAVEAYPDRQPMAAVEREHLELLPKAFAEGDFGWRDAEWVVQWYYRRFLGAFPDDRRRAREGAYGENDYEAVQMAIAGAVDADGAAAKFEHLTALSGVGVEVGSAFLQFIQPEAYLVVSHREWGVLHAADELEAAYPDPPSAADYERYLATCETLLDRCDCGLVGIYRGLWVLGAERDTD